MREIDKPRLEKKNSKKYDNKSTCQGKFEKKNKIQNDINQDIFLNF